MKDLIFLDIALDSTFRTAIERSYEELNDATPEVDYANIVIA
jgi:alpha-glucan, water dikinase